MILSIKSIAFFLSVALPDANAKSYSLPVSLPWYCKLPYCPFCPGAELNSGFNDTESNTLNVILVGRYDAPLIYGLILSLRATE